MTYGCISALRSYTRTLHRIACPISDMIKGSHECPFSRYMPRTCCYFIGALFYTVKENSCKGRS